MGITPPPTGSDMLNAYTKIEDRVKHILEIRPACKGNDKLLIYYYLKFYAPFIKLSFKKIEQLIDYCPAFESITRSRRHVQELNPELKPTERTQKKRFKREVAMHDYFSNSNSLNNYI